jgi:hypothetical protein
MPGKPNFVIILADDMGFSDLGCYGGEIRTPNFDALAAAGLRYTQMYNSARCCPSRAALLTGVHPHQAGIGWMTFGGLAGSSPPGTWRPCGWRSTPPRSTEWTRASAWSLTTCGPAGFSGPSGVESQVGDRLGHLGPGDAILPGQAQVKGQLLGVPRRGQRGDGDQAAVPGRQLRPRPDLAEQGVVGEAHQGGAKSPNIFAAADGSCSGAGPVCSVMLASVPLIRQKAGPARWRRQRPRQRRRR